MKTVHKEIVQTDQAPAAIGTYSQAVRAGNTVYLSGQIPVDPATGEIVSGEFEQRVTQVFENLKAVTEAAGGNLADIVKLNVFLLSMADFAVLNEVMGRYFTAPYPARAAVAVAELPKQVDIEIEAVMVLGDGV